MSTKIAITQDKASHIMFDNGLTVDQVQHALNTISQPTAYYFYMSDILKYIKKITKR